MKIAFVVHDYNRLFGHSRYVAELATRFAGQHEVHVFANVIDGHRPPLIHFHHVAAFRVNALASVVSFYLASLFAVRGRFDVIHGQGLSSWRNHVVTAHQVHWEWYQARRRTSTRLSWREHAFGLLVSALEWQFYRRGAHYQVIAVSRRMRDDLARDYGCVAPTPVVYHGTDLETFSPLQRERHRKPVRHELGLLDDEVVYLFIGDLRKGARQCIRALSELPLGKLLLVSLSKADEMREAAQRLGVSDRVIFAGGTNAPERYYACADVLLLPTPYDSFALVVSEAMACGLPVIVSEKAGVSELVVHGESGFVLKDPAGWQELAEYMRMLSRDGDLRERLGRAARKTMAGRDWDHVASETLKVYEASLRSRDRSLSLPKVGS